MPSSYGIGEHFEQFTGTHIQQGRYASASEALRADLPLDMNSGPGRPIDAVAGRRQARYQQWAAHDPPADEA